MHNSEWGTICNDNWDTADGRVICRMLGFSDVVSAFTAALQGKLQIHFPVNLIKTQKDILSLARKSKIKGGLLFSFSFLLFLFWDCQNWEPGVDAGAVFIHFQESHSLHSQRFRGSIHCSPKSKSSWFF